MTVHECCVTFPRAPHGVVRKERRPLTAGNKPIKTTLEKEALAVALPDKQPVTIQHSVAGDWETGFPKAEGNRNGQT